MSEQGSQSRGRGSNAGQADKRPHSPESRQMCYDVCKKFIGNDKVSHSSGIGEKTGIVHRLLGDSSYGRCSDSTSSLSEKDKRPPLSEPAGSELSKRLESVSLLPYVSPDNNNVTGLGGTVDDPASSTEGKSDGRVAGQSPRNNTSTADGDKISISETVKHASRPAADKANDVGRPVIEIQWELTLDKLIYIAGTMIKTDKQIFQHKIIDDLAAYFMHADLLSYVDELPTSDEAEIFGDLLKTLIKMFDGAKHNMAVLTGCLVCVYWKIAVKSPLPETKENLPVFVRVIGNYVRQLDGAMWAQWFSNDAITLDWFSFIANLFMPKVNFVTAEDRLVIDNVVKYLEKIKYHRYVCAVDKKTVQIPKKGKNRTLKVDKKPRTGRTSEKNAAKKISRRRGAGAKGKNLKNPRR